MSKVYPVFGFLQNEPGTTRLHAGSFEDDQTLCGIEAITSKGWYGDDDLALADVACKRCIKALKGERHEEAN